MKTQFSLLSSLQLTACIACAMGVCSYAARVPDSNLPLFFLALAAVICGFRTIATCLELRNWRKVVLVSLATSIFLTIPIVSGIDYFSFLKYVFGGGAIPWIAAPWIALSLFPITLLNYFVIEFFRILWEIIWVGEVDRSSVDGRLD